VPTLRRITDRDSVRRFLCWLGAQYIRLVHATSRWTVIGGDLPRQYWDRGEPFIACFWHGRLMMMPYNWDGGRTIHILVSRHRDGRFIARTVRHFGFRTIDGSTSKGGTAALRAIYRVLGRGESVVFTPDGPRGPRMRMSPGIVAVARRTGVPILCTTYSTSARRVLGSWDRFLVPLPFGRGVFIWGGPIIVPGDADDAALEAARQAAEARLNEITREADQICGWPAMEPAPVLATAPKRSGPGHPATAEGSR